MTFFPKSVKIPNFFLIQEYPKIGPYRAFGQNCSVIESRCDAILILLQQFLLDKNPKICQYRVSVAI